MSPTTPLDIHSTCTLDISITPPMPRGPPNSAFPEGSTRCAKPYLRTSRNLVGASEAMVGVSPPRFAPLTLPCEGCLFVPVLLMPWTLMSSRPDTPPLSFVLELCGFRFLVLHYPVELFGGAMELGSRSGRRGEGGVSGICGFARVRGPPAVYEVLQYTYQYHHFPSLSL